jgi:hypothetical protein
MYPDSDILFPYRAIAPLRDERGDDWRHLVEQVAKQSDGNEDILAFCLMMIRMCECLNCEQSSYKASLGCVNCARRTVSSEKLSDPMLLDTFEQTRQEIREQLRGSGIGSAQVE